MARTTTNHQPRNHSSFLISFARRRMSALSPRVPSLPRLTDSREARIRSGDVTSYRNSFSAATLAALSWQAASTLFSSLQLSSEDWSVSHCLATCAACTRSLFTIIAVGRSLGRSVLCKLSFPPHSVRFSAVMQLVRSFVCHSDLRQQSVARRRRHRISARPPCVRASEASLNL